MANKLAKRTREERAANDEAAIARRLQAAKVERAKTGGMEPHDIGMELHARFAANAIRHPKDFARSLKTRDESRIRLAYALFCFTNYPVPRHVQSIFADHVPVRMRRISTGRPYPDHEKFEGRDIFPSVEGAIEHPRDVPRWHAQTAYNSERISNDRLRLNTFFAIGAGKSLFKEVFKHIGLNKKEAHVFINCALNLTFMQTIVFAMARSYTDDIGHAQRIALSRFGGDFRGELRREAIRFFAINPMSIQRINDFYDFIQDRDVEYRRESRVYSLKGRTLESLTRQMTDWHHELGRAKRIGNVSWAGLPVMNGNFRNIVQAGGRNSKKGGKRDWRITQILVGKDLAKEGTAMHHCVASYKGACMSGRTGIFSVTSKGENDAGWERNLTVEVNNNGSIVQIRGYANRVAYEAEMHILKMWASENGLQLNRYA